MILGLDIGGTKCATIIGDRDGNVVDRLQWASDVQRGPGPMIDDLVTHARTLLERNGPVRSVGVSIGGPLDCDRGIIFSPPNLPGWDRIDLKDKLEQAFQVPVAVEHDAAACALAEFRWGLGRDLPRDASLCYLTCGTGFGAGLVLGGRVHHGAAGRSPEMGHVRLTDDGPTGFGKAGSFEGWCAGSSLPRIAARAFPTRWQAAPPDGRQLVQLVEEGDDDARAVLTVHAQATGRACAALADMLFPHVIALGSLARYLPPMWMEAVIRVVRDEALPSAVELCTIAPAALGERLQDLSALAAAPPER